MEDKKIGQNHPLALFSIEDHELSVQEAFCLARPEIFISGGEERYILIQEALVSFTQPSLARKIASALMTAQARSLRTAQLMASRGYPQEAATITRTALERGFLQAFISNNEERANRWHAHTSTENPFERFFNCVKAVGKRWYGKGIERQAFEDAEEAMYAHISSYAHNNPSTTKLLDLRVVDGKVMLSTMPVSTAQGFIGCASIFLAAQRAAELSLHAFVEAFSSDDAERRVWQGKIEQLSKERQQQHAWLEVQQNNSKRIEELQHLLDEKRNARLSQLDRERVQKPSL